ncbi:lipopolysaccharide export system protein LptC [Pseudoduganella flava]|uniref:LPS export ABC transporter periplasmic protein LptC n=1 Tax=Pseudoduganella flava TaxID=871742 RepID=A0A562PLZ1_9BURK|nr:LPS export ABC transporter periplasmic protein LptC [Pseudoduganella flava]QGZ40882.1 LPS export ABC transporter periplasmic protein LptC [Pseudoduganella flava]TWI45444.1 lipopolysaccharide export system protein LptC [Pseudoduganella flava]
MRNQRIAHRYRVSIGMLLALFGALGSFWLLQLMNRAGEEMEAGIKIDEPDYIVAGFSFVRMTKDGRPSYIISGDKLTHRPSDDSSLIDKPVVRSLSGDKPPMDIRAERARVDQENTRVTLQENVRINRAAEGTSREMEMTTQALTIFPEEDRMETDKPVHLRMGNATVTGAGMKANNATRQVALQGRGTLVYPPRGR